MPARRQAANTPEKSTATIGFEAKLWLAADAKRGFRDRRQQTLFIDARKLGTLIDRVHRELTDADLEKITSTYHAWRGDSVSRGGAEHAEKTKISSSESLSVSASLREYSDIPGFCKSATTAEIAAHGHVLTPGRYVGAEEVEDDGHPFEEKMPRLVAELEAQFKESAKLEAAIHANCFQSRILATLRDTLLPKLLSGELSVVETLST